MVDSQQEVYEFGNFRLETAERRLTRDGVEVVLQSRAFDVLKALVENSGHLVTKESLYQRVWKDQYVEEANLTVHISALRRTLGTGYIDTVKGHGYRFVSDVRESNGGGADRLINGSYYSRVTIEHESEDGDKPARKTRGSALPLVSALAVLAIVAATGFGVYVWRGNQNATDPDASFQAAGIKRLTTNGRIVNAALSRDGKLFAYAMQQTDGRHSMWLGHSDGSREIELRPAAEVAISGIRFSPDNSSIYFTQNEEAAAGVLYRIPVFGGVSERLKENVRSYISISPKGDAFVHVRQDRDADKSSILVTRLDGTSERELASRPFANAFVPTTIAWAPDGKSIAVAAIVAEDRGQPEIYRVAVENGHVARVTNLGWKSIRVLNWLNDNQNLLAVGVSKGTDFDSRLWQLSLSTGEAKQIATDLSVYGTVLDVSADNNSVLAVQAEHQSNIWTANTSDLSKAKQVTFDATGKYNGWGGIDVTSDGRIAYTVHGEGGFTVWLMNSDGSERRQLLPSGSSSTHPSISGNDRFIVFDSDRTGTSEIWRADLDGRDANQLTTGGRNTQPHASSDGTEIVYVSGQPPRLGLYRISIDGGEPTRLVETAPISPRVSPDGRMVAYGYSANGKPRLAVVMMENGAPVREFEVPRLANFNTGIRWTADGMAITYRDWANGLWRQAVVGGEPERIAGLPEEKLYSYAWSRDGRSLVFVRGQETRDVVMITRAK